MKMAPLNEKRRRRGVGREWAAMAEACRVPDDDDDEGSSSSSIWNDSSSSAPDIILKRTVVCCHLFAGAIGWRPSSCACHFELQSHVLRQFRVFSISVRTQFSLFVAAAPLPPLILSCVHVPLQVEVL